MQSQHSDGSPDHGNSSLNPNPPPRELTPPGSLRDSTLSFDTGCIPSNDGGDGASDWGPPPDEPLRLPGEPDVPAKVLMTRALLKRSCNKRGALERGPESLRIIAARDLEYQAAGLTSL